LFGHERGAFTGAVAARQGLFELANQGTIFLDELGELRKELQPKLLRVLEQREIRRVGGSKPIKVDVRVIAATNRVLADEVKAGRFREDLFYRLSVLKLRLPPLRERKEDIPLLVKHFLRIGKFNRTPEDKMRIRGISRDALDCLYHYKWPGNIRELLNVVERACSLSESDTVQVHDLPEHVSGVRIVQKRVEPEAETRKLPTPDLGQNFKTAKEAWIAQFEKDYLSNLMQRHDGNITRASKDAELDRKHLRRLLQKYGLHGKKS
jgi:transcriptional regulator with GAF, ATPase, and Fis domain